MSAESREGTVLRLAQSTVICVDDGNGIVAGFKDTERDSALKAWN